MKLIDKIKNAFEVTDSLVCVGLDTEIEKIPEYLKDCANPILEFNKAIIETTKDHACAYKLNLAFYEAEGIKGYEAMVETVKLIPSHIISIADAKRGDIGNTARMYAKALFNTAGFDMTTVNPYMGHDSVKPFLEDSSKGAFVLCLTSNPGALDFQLRDSFYVKTAEKIAQWNIVGNCGAVVGATRPEHIERIRGIIGDAVMLIPGIGAQGGDLEGVLSNALTADKKGLIINSSRGIIYKSSGKDFAEKAGEAALELKNQINNIRYR